MRAVAACVAVVGLLTLSGCGLCFLPCYLCAGSTSGAPLASASPLSSPVPLAEQAPGLGGATTPAMAD